MLKQETLQRVLRFRDDRNWRQFHTPKDLALTLNLEAAELLEVFQWSGADLECREKRDQLKAELADVVTCCILMADACGLELDEELVISAGTFFIHDAYHATAAKLARGCGFTALFAISDNMAMGAMRALREAGRTVPEDCSVIAIDGLEVSEYIDPPLATLCQPMEEMGRRSVKILGELIEGTGEHRQEILPTTYRPGASVRHI